MNNENVVVTLKKIIAGYEKEINKFDVVNNSAIILYKEEIDSLRKDYHNIVNFDIKVVEAVLEEAKVSPMEKDVIVRYLTMIRSLLISNRDYNTSYVVDDKQLEYIKMFLEKADTLKEQIDNVKNENYESISNISGICKKYQKLIGFLEDKSVFIENKDIIDSLVCEDFVDNTIKEKILFAIVQHNQDVYENLCF